MTKIYLSYITVIFMNLESNMIALLTVSISNLRRHSESGLIADIFGGGETLDLEKHDKTNYKR